MEGGRDFGFWYGAWYGEPGCCCNNLLFRGHMGLCVSFSILHESTNELFISGVRACRRNVRSIFSVASMVGPDLSELQMLDSHVSNGTVDLPDYGRRTLSLKDFLDWLRCYNKST